MRTRPLSIDEITPSEDFGLSLQHVVRIDCILTADWEFMMQLLIAIYTTSCSGRIVVQIPDVDADATLHPDNRIWLLEKYLICHSRPDVWQRYQMLLALERIEIRFAPHMTSESLGNPFGHLTYADGRQAVFTLMQAPGSAKRLLWLDNNEQRITWSTQAFAIAWNDRFTLEMPASLVQRLTTAPGAAFHAVVDATAIRWLVPHDTAFVSYLLQMTQAPMRLIHRCQFIEQRMVRMVYTARTCVNQGHTVALVVAPLDVDHFMALCEQFQLPLGETCHIYADTADIEHPATVWLFAAESCVDQVMRSPTIQRSFHQAAHAIIFGMMATLDNIESLWRCLVYLSVGCDSVLGNTQSRWRRSTSLELVGRGDFLADASPAEIWEWVRNPLPDHAHHPWFAEIRTNLRIGSQQDIAHRMAFQTQLSRRNQERLRQLTNDFCTRMTPWSRCVIDETVQYHETFLQRISIHESAWQYAANLVVQRILAILHMRKHCVFWVDQSIDTLLLRDACQRDAHVAVVYIGENDCTVNGTPSLLSLIPSLLRESVCLVLVTPAAAARIWGILPSIDITIHVDSQPPPLTAQIKRWMIGRHEQWYWDETHELLTQRVLQRTHPRTLGSVHVPQLEPEPNYAWQPQFHG